MRTLLLAGALAVAGFAIATPISVAPASAQVAIDTPIGGVRVGPQRHYYRDYDRPALMTSHTRIFLAGVGTTPPPSLASSSLPHTISTRFAIWPSTPMR